MVVGPPLTGVPTIILLVVGPPLVRGGHSGVHLAFLISKWSILFHSLIRIKMDRTTSTKAPGRGLRQVMPSCQAMIFNP